VLVVEGPDGAGKTTLARTLSQHYGFRIEGKDKSDRSEPEGPPKRSAKERTWEALGFAVAAHTPVVIYDRLFVSELIYGPIVRHKLEFGSRERYQCEIVMAALGIPFVLCMPPKEIVLENLARGEQYARGLQAEIYQAYESYWPPLLNTVRYDYTQWDNRPVFQQIDFYLERRKERSW
jgi:thymidylate kinase